MLGSQTGLGGSSQGDAASSIPASPGSHTQPHTQHLTAGHGCGAEDGFGMPRAQPGRAQAWLKPFPWSRAPPPAVPEQQGTVHPEREVLPPWEVILARRSALPLSMSPGSTSTPQGPARSGGSRRAGAHLSGIIPGSPLGSRGRNRCSCPGRCCGSRRGQAWTGHSCPSPRCRKHLFAPRYRSPCSNQGLILPQLHQLPQGFWAETFMLCSRAGERR